MCFSIACGEAYTSCDRFFLFFLSIVLHKSLIVGDPSFPLAEWDRKEETAILHTTLQFYYWLIRIVATDEYLFMVKDMDVIFCSMQSWVSGTKAGIFLCCWLLQLVTALYGIFSEEQTHSVPISESRLNSFQKPHTLARQDVWLSLTVAAFCVSWAAISVFKLNWIRIFSARIIIALWS